MANSYELTSAVAARAVASLYANAVMIGLVSRDYDNEFVAGRGATVNVRKPTTFTTNEFTGTTTIQDVSETHVAVTLEKHYDVSVSLTPKDVALNMVDFTEQVVNPAMNSIAQKVDSYLISKLSSLSAGVTGLDSSNAPASFLAADKVLNDGFVPVDNRYWVAGSAHKQEILGNAQFTDADRRGDSDARRNASLGVNYGFATYLDQNAGANSYAFHRSALILAARDLPKPPAVNSSTANFNGLSVRVTQGYDMSTKATLISFDCLVGAVLVDSARAVKIS